MSNNNHLPDDDPRLKSLCRIGEGKLCCRWLARGGKGYFCAKLDPEIRAWIEQESAAGRVGAQGDNCDGLTP